VADPFAPAESHCPRCGGEFHCAANDAVPCACTTLKLDATMLAALRERYAGCLCLRCLTELANQAPTTISG
jgi:hypothetical protein